MDVRIRPHALAGAVTPPPSKSMAHRLLLAAALADGVSTVKNVALSQDIEATLRCMAALGASWERTDKSNPPRDRHRRQEKTLSGSFPAL